MSLIPTPSEGSSRPRGVVAGENGLGVGQNRGPRSGYPRPTTAAASAIMRANPSRDTGPEVRLRRLLHAAGLRYRVNYSIRIDDRRPVSMDMAFPRQKLAVFVDGCFWHACPVHGSVPKVNSQYWPEKLRRNVERDQETTRRLQLAGWHVVRCWEHESPDVVVIRIAALVKRQTLLASRPTTPA